MFVVNQSIVLSQDSGQRITDRENLTWTNQTLWQTFDEKRRRTDRALHLLHHFPLPIGTELVGVSPVRRASTRRRREAEREVSRIGPRETNCHCFFLRFGHCRLMAVNEHLGKNANIVLDLLQFTGSRTELLDLLFILNTMNVSTSNETSDARPFSPDF